MNKLCFVQWALSKAKIECMKPIFARIETLQVKDCKVEGDFYENFLRYCTNLKQLHVQDVDFTKMKMQIECFVYIVSDSTKEPQYGWLFQEYPLLEHFELTPSKNVKIPLLMFFQKNPKLRSFSTNSNFFCANLNSFMKTASKLESLIVDGSCDRDTPRKFYNGLNKLYQQGFYEKLHLRVRNGVESNLDSNIIQNALEVLYVDVRHCQSFHENLPFLGALHIKELGIFDSFYVPYMETLAKNLIKLEGLRLTNATFKNILAYIRYAPNLKSIQIQNLLIKDHVNNEVLDVSFLNRERQKLIGANKVVIYVKEHLFLLTKWATKRIDLDLIELKRIESCKLAHRL